jgi:AcrR family transcriptional regulator
MARPRSEDRRNAILSAAASVVAEHGLDAVTTAAIAKRAGVSNGSLFVYFATKAELMNVLYVSLKLEMGTVAMAALPSESSPRDQLHFLWTRWVEWATEGPEKRRALAQLQVSDVITQESHDAAASAWAAVAELLERCRADGPLREVELGFVLLLINAIAEAAIDALLADPAATATRADAAFDAIWRVLAGTSPISSP